MPFVSFQNGSYATQNLTHTLNLIRVISIESYAAELEYSISGVFTSAAL